LITDLLIIVAKWVFQILFLRMIKYILIGFAKAIIRLGLPLVIIIFMWQSFENPQMSKLGFYAGIIAILAFCFHFLEINDIKKKLKR